jgi:hypothetical protein
LVFGVVMSLPVIKVGLNVIQEERIGVIHVGAIRNDFPPNETLIVRNSDPEGFSSAIGGEVLGTAIFAGLAGLGFYFYRRLSD